MNNFLLNGPFINYCTIPIFGIHIGGLGFLSQANSDNFIESLKEIFKDQYSIVNRMQLKTIINGNNKQIFYALNDIVIDHGNSPRILESIVSISGKHLNKYKSDGIIIKKSAELLQARAC